MCYYSADKKYGAEFLLMDVFVGDLISGGGK